uniref:Methionyl aminopeptidase 1 n=1 Tax=Accipiter nisus TaxID=211598 RepID=A0A8B9M4X1_9AVES
MAAVETRVCETAGCSSEAKLQCPTCLKLGIQGSYFCSQEHGRIIRGRNDNRKIEVNGSAEKAQRKAEFSPENSPESGPDGEKEWLSSMACQEFCRIEGEGVCNMQWYIGSALSPEL